MYTASDTQLSILASNVMFCSAIFCPILSSTVTFNWKPERNHEKSRNRGTINMKHTFLPPWRHVVVTCSGVWWGSVTLQAGFTASYLCPLSRLTSILKTCPLSRLLPAWCALQGHIRLAVLKREVLTLIEKMSLLRDLRGSFGSKKYPDLIQKSLSGDS